MTCHNQSGLKLEYAVVRKRPLIGRSAWLLCDHVCTNACHSPSVTPPARTPLTACAHGAGLRVFTLAASTNRVHRCATGGRRAGLRPLSLPFFPTWAGQGVVGRTRPEWDLPVTW